MTTRKEQKSSYLYLYLYLCVRTRGHPRVTKVGLFFTQILLFQRTRSRFHVFKSKMWLACNFIFKCELLRPLSKQLRYYNKTDRFRLTNHKITVDHASSSSMIIIASQESLLHLFLRSWNQSIRILDHVINQFIYLRHDKAAETRKVGVGKF